MHMIPVGADLQELELIASLDPQTDVSQRLVDRRIEHGSSIFGWKHQVVEQNRNVMALVDVEAHPRDLRRKRRGMHPKGFNAADFAMGLLLWRCCWRIRRVQAGCAMSRTKADWRVRASGVPASQAATRTRLRAAAVSTCWRWTFARPMERARRSCLLR